MWLRWQVDADINTFLVKKHQIIFTLRLGLKLDFPLSFRYSLAQSAGDSYFRTSWISSCVGWAYNWDGLIYKQDRAYIGQEI